MTAPRQYKYYDLVMAAFVTVLLCANLIGVQKVSHVTLPFYGEYIYGAGVLFFPLSYIFGDILTEVYGYKRSRRVIWAGFGAAALMALVLWIVTTLPIPTDQGPHPQSEAFNRGLASTPFIVLGSLVAYFAGSFSNSFVLAKLKLATAGRWLWSRTIGSTLIGEAIDTLLFVGIAFALGGALLGSPMDSNF